MNLPAVCFAIPAMDELGTLEKTLDCIARQDYLGKKSVWVCVNGPYSDYETAYHDSFWQATEHKTNQQATDHKTDQQAFDLETAADATSFDNITPEIRHAKMRILHNELLWNHLIQNPWNLDLHLIDRYSPEKAWREKQAGVGLARQQCIAALLPHASDDSILISMDADTLFHPDFVREVVHCLQRHPHTTAVNPPYYHPLSGDEAQDRAMLRYEIYLRCHLIQLLRIGSPYAFTALGSAIACRLSDYQKSGGYDSQQAGEDFYLLQKLAKMGKIALDCRAKVYPANRLSDRVPFGTGPAIKIFQEGIQGKYPIFSKKGYDAIAQSYQMLPALQQADVHTPLTNFLDETFPQKGGWDKLRKNYPGLANFTKAFHQKADGLRLFQFLKAFRLANPSTDEENLQELWNLMTEASHDNPPAPLPSPLRLDHLNAATLHLIRLELETFEERLRMRRE